MWQILSGIYFIVTILSAVLLWSFLVLAKKSDRNPERPTQPLTDLTIGDKDRPIDDQILELPTLNQFSEK